MRKKATAALAVLFILLFCGVAARLSYLMLARGAELSAQAQKQMSRSLDYYQYARGEILDRQGRSFTGQREPCLVLIPAMIKDVEALAAELSRILQLGKDLTLNRLAAVKSQILTPVIFKTGLSVTEAESLREAQLPGALALTLAARYGKEAAAAHIVGNVQAGEQANSMSGVSGIELQYDEALRGRVDEQAVSWVDATGRLSSEDWHVYAPDASSRQDVRLTLDKDYQQIAERALADYQGACVVLDPYSGDIFAAASTPGFDPYGWQAPATADTYVNKAFSYYPPASTFKILLALAAADSGLPPAMEGFCCTGSALIGDTHNINCWNRTGHGEEDMAQALAGSCNAYFASLGWELGGATLRDYLERCGLAQQRILGYAVPSNTALSFNAAVPGDVANISIGENGARLTPLLVAQLAAICANGGYALTPRLVLGICDQDGRVISEQTAEAPRRAVSSRAAQQVAAMLRMAVTDGTVKALREALVPVAAKTGTSENAGVWCAGFAPYAPGNEKTARWAIAIYVADGRSGGQEAAAVFKRVVDDLVMLEGM